MSEYDVLLRDGGIAHVRTLRPGDRAALHDLVQRTSEHSAYLRFFTGGRSTAHTYMDRITSPDYHGRALVAFLGGRLVGLGEHIPGGQEDEADLGVLIDDAAHGRGLGTLLIEHLAVDAWGRGVKTMVATVLASNTAMLRVIHGVGLDVEQTVTGTEVEIRIPLGGTARLLEGIQARDHEAERASLTKIMSPRSVAVVGAGRTPGGVGHRVLRNLAEGGFEGKVYPVNPRADTLLGLPCYDSVRQIPAPVDVAVVAVPAALVLDVARDCARAGVAGLAVLSAGFAEAGLRGSEKELLAICREAGMRLIGPNCLGIVNTPAKLNATFLPYAPIEGRVGVLSQSGAVATAVLDRLGERGLGISSFVSVGNKADVSGNDLLEFWEDDPATDIIALYLESFGNPERFVRIARRVAQHKPVLLVKSGRTASGGRAVASHTAAAATPDAAVDALVQASGVIRLDSVQELLDLTMLLATQPLPKGSRVAIVGNSGGPEAMAADAFEREGMVVPPLSAETMSRLAVRIGAAAALGNPVDLTADADAAQIGFAVETVLDDPNVDVVLAVYTPPFGSGREASEQAIAEAAKNTDKTVLACVIGHDGLIGGRIPSFAFPEQAAAAAAKAAAYARWRERPAVPPPAEVSVDVAEARRIVREELAAHPAGGWLDQETAERLVACYGIVTAPMIAVDSPEAAELAAEKLATTVVLKATGPDLVHKSDVGGVQIGIRTPEEAAAAYRAMAERVGESMTGAIVQRMLPEGVEIIVGGVSYEAFGPLVMVGMGGVTANLLNDRSFRVPPISEDQAIEMIGELRGGPLLYGYRGRRPAAVGALADQVNRVARLMADVHEIAELDMNPVMVTPREAVTVDLRIRVAPSTPQPSPFLRRLR